MDGGVMSITVPETVEKQTTFFRFLFEGTEGYICIAKRSPVTKVFEERFFRWPTDIDIMLEYVNANSIASDIYYCPMLFHTGRRAKETVSTCPSLWSDLDYCPPSKMLVEPSMVIESSPMRYQALWRLSEDMEPADAEELSKRIAYFHENDGADKTGWDLTQLLRVPLTYNHKYQETGLVQVKFVSAKNLTYEASDFDAYPHVEGYQKIDIPMPPEAELLDPDELLERHKSRLQPTIWGLYSLTPEHDWSKALWQLQMICFEAGMERAEVFSVARAAKCNKYERDGRQQSMLWKEVCKAHLRYQDTHGFVVVSGFKDVPILSDDERKWAESETGIVEEYIEWCKSLGDAAWQYHQAGAFVVLSSLLAGKVKLPTSFGVVVPNLWFMILADTTLTRKTTAMDMAIDLVLEIDSDVVLATDGSIEGLFTALALRPNRPSVFLRDEFSGLLEAITKKDYYAGMAETLTKLYDGKFQKRVLRKETIEVRDPVLILFAGGIRDRVLSLLTYEHVASGFLPRFIFITAESDVTRLKPLGPPAEKALGQKDLLMSRLRHIRAHYDQVEQIHVNDKLFTGPKRWDAKLTPDAWKRYNQIENDMLMSALNSTYKDVLTPCFDRLSKSGLKAAVLLSAARRMADDVLVEEQDIVRAFAYIEQWRSYTLDVIQNIGRSGAEADLQRVFQAVIAKPGVLRSELMQRYRLNSREADGILSTLEQRALVNRVKTGRTEKLFPTNM